MPTTTPGPPVSRDICTMVASPMAKSAEPPSTAAKVWVSPPAAVTIIFEAVLLEDAGVHADIEVDVAEVVHRLAEADLLEVGGGGRAGSADRQPDDRHGKQAAEPPFERW